MKVWYVFPQFPAPSETFAGNDVRALRELGAELRVLNLRPSHPASARLLREWDLEGLEVDECSPSKLVVGLGWMCRRPLVLSYLLRVIVHDNWRRPVHLAKSLLALPRVFSMHRTLQGGSPDVVHLFWGHYASLLGLAIRRTHPGVVVTMFLGAYDLRSRYRTSARLAKVADAVFTHARENLPLLDTLGIPVGQVSVVYRGVDLQRLQARPHQRVPFRIASAGYLVEKKGMAEVLGVFELVQRRWPKSSLCIIGDGPDRERLEGIVHRLSLASVEFTGFVEHRQVFERLCEAEVFVYMSTQDHLPNVVKEAIAAECACVVSRTVGIEELVCPGECGFVVEQGDFEAAARRVSDLFSEPDLRTRVVSRASAHLREDFDLQRSMTVYRDTWARLLADRRSVDRDAAGGQAPAPMASEPLRTGRQDDPRPSLGGTPIESAPLRRAWRIGEG